MTSKTLKIQITLIEFMNAEKNGQVDVLLDRELIKQSANIQYKSNLIPLDNLEIINIVMDNYEELKKEQLNLM